MISSVKVAFLDNPLALSASAKAVERHLDEVAATPDGEILPNAVRAWMARVRLLEGVPFAHLAPDAELLPPESIRFFYVDREWTDALLQGVLSVGSVTTLDREHLQALHRPIRAEVDTEERQVRLVGSDPPGRAPADTITGFLLRSRAVSGWPALHVRGYSSEIGPDNGPVAENDPRRLRLLRLERLAPAVLLCLFDGIPQVVHVEEPRQGIQFGVDLAPGAQGTWGATIDLRDVTTAKLLKDTVPKPTGDLTKRVPFRKGAPGVVHMAELAKRIADQTATKVSQFEAPGVQSAELAMELLQFPFRQVFGDPDQGTVAGGTKLAYEALFRPTVSIETVRAWNRQTQP